MDSVMHKCEDEEEEACETYENAGAGAGAQLTGRSIAAQ